MELRVLFVIEFVTLSGLLFAVNGDNAFQCTISEPCIMVNMEATFNLSRTVVPTQVAAPFTVQYAYVLEADCSCYDGTIFSREPSMTIMLDSGEKLVFNFSRDHNNDVNLALDFYLQPSKHFRIPGTTIVQLFSDAPLAIGQRNHSYVCETPTVVKFSKGLDYYMTMTVSNLQVQAYDIKEGMYSPYTECPADMTTSGPSTTKPELVQDRASTDDDTLYWKSVAGQLESRGFSELDAVTIRSADQTATRVDPVSFAIGGLVAACAGLSFVVGILVYLRKKTTPKTFIGL